MNVSMISLALLIIKSEHFFSFQFNFFYQREKIGIISFRSWRQNKPWKAFIETRWIHKTLLPASARLVRRSVNRRSWWNSGQLKFYKKCFSRYLQIPQRLKSECVVPTVRFLKVQKEWREAWKSSTAWGGLAHLINQSIWKKKGIPQLFYQAFPAILICLVFVKKIHHFDYQWSAI